MARPITFTPTPPNIGPDAQQELDRLIETLHRHGVLRLANDLVASNAQIAETVFRALNSPGAQNAIQNLSLLLMTLGQIEPRAMYRFAGAAGDALRSLDAAPPEADDHPAPGVTGAYRLLHDDDLWRALMPLVGALKAFAGGLARAQVDKPVTGFTGKQTQA